MKHSTIATLILTSAIVATAQTKEKTEKSTEGG
jgi:hypothetical protein